MALVRVTALKDFRTNALTTTDVSTGYQLGGLSTGQKAYAGLHLLTPADTGRPLALIIQSATASGFGSPSTRFTFTLSSVGGGEWGTPVGNLSTDHKWWRANWTLSTAASTAGAPKGLVYMGIR